MHPELKLLPLPGFKPLVIAALWQGKLPPLPAAFLELVKARAAELSRPSAPPRKRERVMACSISCVSSDTL